MKKFSPYILILVISAGILLPMHFAHAGFFDGLLDFTFLARILFSGFMEMASWLTALAGLFLNFVLDYTIIGMKAHLADIKGINIAWQLIRDLMNIAFIFLLVYEGIKLIIGQGNIPYIKKFISMIVLSSILINFSLFFTKVMIDASNVITIGFYQSIISDSGGTAGVTLGLSGKITTNLGISGILNPDMGTAWGSADFGGVVIIGFGSILIYLVSAFVFFAVAILFVVRYMTLIILLALSPIAYMGMSLPFMKTYSDDWWNAFKSQLLFAPIYMIMTWLVLILMKDLNTTGTFGDMFASGGKAPDPSKMGILFNFALMIGLLIASLVTAKSTSTKGSKLIGQATSKFTAFAGGAVMGGAASLARKSIGQWGANQANDEELKKKVSEGTATMRERLKFSVGTRAGNASFDARRSWVGETLQNATQTKMGSGTIFNDKAGKGGFNKEKEERIKKETKYAESLKPSDLYIEEQKKKVEDEEGKAAKEAEGAHLKSEGDIERLNALKIEQQKILDSGADNSDKVMAQAKIEGLNKEIANEKQNEERLKKAYEEAEKRRKAKMKEIDDIYSKRIEAYAKRFEYDPEAKKSELEKLNKEKEEAEKRLRAVSSKPLESALVQKEIDEINNKIRGANTVGSKASFRSKYGSTIARMGVGAVVGGTLAGPIGAVIGAVHQGATAPKMPPINGSEMASKIRAVSKKKKGELSKEDKKKYKKVVKDPNASKEDKVEAWEKLGMEGDDEDEDETPTPPKEPEPTNPTT